MMLIKTRCAVYGLAFGLLALALIVFAGACGGGEAATTTIGPETTVAVLQTTTTTLGEAELVGQNWEAFFDPATQASEKLALLENGAAHQAELEAWTANPAAAAASVQVTDVKVNADGTAEVTFDVIAGGTTVSAGETGTAVLKDGVWKVSESSFAGMLASLSGAGGGTGTATTD